MSGKRGDSTIEELVGQNVKAVRERKGLSQDELGKKLKPFLGKAWSRQAVSLAESGARSFVVAELTALALVLETSVLRLLGPTPDDRIKLPAKGIDRGQMIRALFGPRITDLLSEATGRSQLEAMSEDLQVCLDEARGGLASLENFTKNVDKLVKDGWAIAPKGAPSAAPRSRRYAQ